MLGRGVGTAANRNEDLHSSALLGVALWYDFCVRGVRFASQRYHSLDVVLLDNCAACMGAIWCTLVVCRSILLPTLEATLDAACLIQATVIITPATASKGSLATNCTHYHPSSECPFSHIRVPSGLPTFAARGVSPPVMSRTKSMSGSYSMT